jgi:DNA-directed RNA polymerase specialized sigma24 family protein
VCVDDAHVGKVAGWTLLSWRRISRHQNAHAYAHRTLVNAYLGQRRTRKSGEIPVDRLPEHSSQPGTAELRVVMLDALATLPPQAGRSWCCGTGRT